MASERITMNAGRLPGRKQRALYIERRPAGGGAVIEVLAYFRTEAAFEEYMALRPMYTPRHATRESYVEAEETNG